MYDVEDVHVNVARLHARPRVFGYVYTIFVGMKVDDDCDQSREIQAYCDREGLELRAIYWEHRQKFDWRESELEQVVDDACEREDIKAVVFCSKDHVSSNDEYRGYLIDWLYKHGVKCLFIR